MAIYPDKKNGKLTGRFRVEVQLAGNRKRGRYDTFKEAQEADEAFRKALMMGDTSGSKRKFTKDRSRPQGLAEAVRRASGLLWAGLSVEQNNFQKLNFLVSVLGPDTSLDSITTESMDKVTKAIGDRREDISDATYNRYYSAFNVFLKWCLARGYRTEPLPTFSWRDEDEGRIRWLDYLEEAQLMALLRGNLPKLVKVAIATGMRRSELLGLNDDQVQPAAVHLWKTKNGTARTIPITPETYRDLRVLLSDGMPSPSHLRYEWDRAKKVMGLEHDEDFVFHACRHTFATRHVQANTNIRVLQRLMGHKRIETTMRYSHVSEAMLSEAIFAAQKHHDSKAIDHGLIHARNLVGACSGGGATLDGRSPWSEGKETRRKTGAGVAELVDALVLGASD